MTGLSAAVYEEGKMAYRHPPPVNWKMLIDFSKVLGDPEYVRWQVSDGLRPRADVQRAVNAAAASFAKPITSARGASANGDEDHGVDGAATGDADADADDPPQRAREIAFSTIPGVAGVVRAKRTPFDRLGARTSTCTASDGCSRCTTRARVWTTGTTSSTAPRNTTRASPRRFRGSQRGVGGRGRRGGDGGCGGGGGGGGRDGDGAGGGTGARRARQLIRGCVVVGVGGFETPPPRGPNHDPSARGRPGGFPEPALEL